MKGQFFYTGATETFKTRQLLGKGIEVFHRGELERTQLIRPSDSWNVTLGENLIFNAEGLALITQALDQYKGPASMLSFSLRMDPVTFDLYYSLQKATEGMTDIRLPVSAVRHSGSELSGNIAIDLPVDSYHIAYPESLCPLSIATIPTALLMPYTCEFDLLFSNQIAVLNDLRRRAIKSPAAWIRSVGFRHIKNRKKRVALAYKDIHPTAQIHPTAVIEGSVIGANVQIGAHCVVRYSHIAEQVILYDGAKVEFSVVGPYSWLMHDLVLVRSLVEDHVFLIHGPYQFSCFHSKSAAFATILMDYRPDHKPIRVKTTQGLRIYRGRFLGSVLCEGAKVLGGCLLAPGRIVPAHSYLGVESDDIHTVEENNLPQQVPLSPSQTKRKTHEPILD